MWSQFPCTGGLANGVYPCNNVDLKARVPLSSMGASTGNDIWGWSSGNREFAIFGSITGTSFVEITNPTSPVYLGFLPKNSTSNSTWRDMKTIGDYLYVVSERSDHGIQIFELTELLNVSTPPDTFSTTATTIINGSGGRAHNIISNETTGMIYTCGSSSCSGGLEAFGTSNPTNLSYEGCFNIDGYTHDAVCFIYQGPDSTHVGKEICIASNEDTQTIIDFSDPAIPQELSKTGYSNQEYTHQGWITDDHRYLVFDDELDESRNGHNTRTHFMDISDLDAPIYLGYFQGPNASIDHNLYVKGQYAYLANYSAGLRILNIGDLSSVGLGSVSQVGHFDSYIGNNNANFNGVWGVYPYFDSGLVIISDRSSGLFILEATLPHFVMASSKTPATYSPGEEISFNIDLSSYAGYADNVNLSVQDLYNGLSHSFSTSPVPSGGSSTLTISNTQNLCPGNYSFKVTGQGVLSMDKKHEIALAFKISVPDEIVLENQTISIDTWAYAKDSITLNNLTLNSSSNLNIMTNKTIVGPSVSLGAGSNVTIDPLSGCFQN